MLLTSPQHDHVINKVGGLLMGQDPLRVSMRLYFGRIFIFCSFVGFFSMVSESSVPFVNAVCECVDRAGKGFPYSKLDKLEW